MHTKNIGVKESKHMKALSDDLNKLKSSELNSTNAFETIFTASKSPLLQDIKNLLLFQVTESTFIFLSRY